VQRITNGQGVNHVIEISGVGTIRQSLESVAYGGIVSVIGFLKTISQDKMPDVTMMTLVQGCILRGVMGGSKQQLGSWRVKSYLCLWIEYLASIVMTLLPL
jgi:threonine dehydrogenase-like Zn-dependent dehydrogenase